MPVTQSTETPPGWEAPEFMLPGTDDATHLLSDYTQKKALVIVFTCNHCPYAKALWPIFVELYNEYNEDVEFVAINPNDQDEYPEDSFETMKEKVEEWGIPFDYLRDETQMVAESYGAACTPDPYLFKTEGDVPTLFYRGKVNDNWQEPEKVTKEYMKDAIAALLAGEGPPQEQPAAVGCSIKWKKS